jgi:hypothetical protein
LLAFLDSDDRWEPTYLEMQVAAYDRERPTGPVGIVCCDAWLEQDGRRLAQTYGERFGRPLQPLRLDTLLRANTIFTGALCPRDAVEGAGGFVEGLNHAEELDLWVRILELGLRVVYQPIPLVIYALRPDGLSNDAVAMARGMQRVYRGALERGRIDPAARHEAQRGLRLQRAAEGVALARVQARHEPMRAAGTAIASLPSLLRVAADRLARR